MVYSVSAGVVELSRTTVVSPSTTEYMVGAKVTTTPVGTYGKTHIESVCKHAYTGQVVDVFLIPVRNVLLQTIAIQPSWVGR